MAAPGRRFPFGRSNSDIQSDSYRRHAQRKKMVALAAGLLLLPVALVMIARFDQGALGNEVSRLLGATPASRLGAIAQVTITATPEPTASATLFQPPSQTPRPTAVASATSFQTPRPTATASATASNTPVATASATSNGGEATEDADGGTGSDEASGDDSSTDAEAGSGDATDAGSGDESGDAEGSGEEAPAVLPATGMQNATSAGQAIGFVLLAVSLMLIAAGLWPEEDER